jgi:hypothetical protein
MALWQALCNEIDSPTADGLAIITLYRDIMQLIKSYNIQQETPPKFIKILELLKQINVKKGADGKVIIWSIFIQNIHDLQTIYMAALKFFSK